jgi:hypothetical protein
MAANTIETMSHKQNFKILKLIYGKMIPTSKIADMEIIITTQN